MSDVALVLKELVGLRALVEKLVEQSGLDVTDLEAFSDIDPGRLYEIPELVALRGGGRQTYYKAIKSGALRQTESVGRVKVRGSDFVDYLRKRRR